MELNISKEDSDYMTEIIKRIIEECGPRMPCSSQEAQSAEIIKKELEKTCDDVALESFSCNPRAFLGFIKIDILLVLTSFLAFFLIPLNLTNYWGYLMTLISFSLNLISFLILWNEFFNYREFIDPLFKSKNSQNVVGRIHPKDEVKRILIFSGHHDSALEFNLLTRLKIGYPVLILLGISIMIIWLVTSLIIVLLILANLFYYELFIVFILTLFIIGIPAFIGLFFFVSFGDKANTVPGAVDNLSAVAIVLAVGKILKKNKEIVPKNTEIRLISFGCEEAGLRGAFRYVSAHFNELKKYEAECVNMDAIQSKDYISIIDFEPSTRTKHSDVMVRKLKEAAKSANIKVNESALGGSGKTEKIIGQITGGTDATAFSKAGVKAANISAMDLKKMLQFYHQPTDTFDKIEKEALERVLKICIAYITNES
ncbi:MAG TPA: M28 family peptidase [Candidatus Nanopelagicaceae bacterium]|nr:M28 family peptidase [Candidatus Nanopelagicaceae bacterium]